MLEIDCAWSKGSGERLQGHHGPLVILCNQGMQPVKTLLTKEKMLFFFFNSVSPK